MADLIVLVPGITGSVLRRPGGPPVWKRSLPTLARAAVSLSATLDALRLPDGLGDEAPDPAHRLDADGLITGWHAWPGVHTGSGYHGLIQLAHDLRPAAVRAFAYDWRLSNRYNAAELGRRIESWLGALRDKTDAADARVTLVCHSMGGLIARYYLEVLGGREVTAELITLGTPYSGAVKAVRMLAGDAYASVPVIGDRITDTARTFPALRQLLPVYRCNQTADGPVDLVHSSIPGLDNAYVRDAARFHNEIATAIRQNGLAPYATHVVAGTRNQTLQSLSVDQGRTRYHNSQRDVDHSGDGTVATFSAVPPEWVDTSAAELHTVRHAALPSSASPLAVIRNKLAPTVLRETLHPTFDLGLGLPDIASTSEGIPIASYSTRADLLLHATAADPATGEIVSATELAACGYGKYAGSLHAPPGLWYIAVTAVAELPPTMAADLVLVTTG